MEDDGYARLAVAMIASAVEVYTSGSYPPNVSSGGFPSPRMEALTFLHGDLYEWLMDMLEIEDDTYLLSSGVPLPSSSCPCESCRLDYTVEAILMEKDKDLIYEIGGVPKLAYQFAPDEPHIVYWDDEIKYIMPYKKSSVLKADQYLKDIQ